MSPRAIRSRPTASRIAPVIRSPIPTFASDSAAGASQRRSESRRPRLLVEMSPQGESHVIAIVRLTRHFRTAEAWLMVQLPLELRPGSEPEPDLTLIAGSRHPSTSPARRCSRWRCRSPRTKVSVNSHKKDRGAKVAEYARAGVATDWLVDVPGRTVEVRTEPGPEGCARCEPLQARRSRPLAGRGRGDAQARRPAGGPLVSAIVPTIERSVRGAPYAA